MHTVLWKQKSQMAIEHFKPSMVVGLMLHVVLDRVAPAQSWMLPGLWQLLFCLGIFASCRFLPRPMFTVGLWYMVTGRVGRAGGGGRRGRAPGGGGGPGGGGRGV